MRKNRVSVFVSRLAVAVAALLCAMVRLSAGTFTENFTADPLQNGWRIFGDTNLFQWNSTNHTLAVTWDSAQTTSYFYHPLGTILAAEDDFSLEFDLNLADASAELYGSELAVGFLNTADATSPTFSRASGTSPNVAEFDYFPPSLLDPSLDATLIDASNNFYFGFNTLLLNPGTVYHIHISHLAGDPSLHGQVLTNGVLYADLTNTYPSAIKDFRLDTISISSYQDDGFGDTMLAHGTVGNLVAVIPQPPVQNLAVSYSNPGWQVQFTDRTNWRFTLERSTNLFNWSDASATVPGVGNGLTLQDTNAPADKAFYRVRAQRP